MITKFTRLDRALIAQGLVATIERAHELIQNGAVSVNGAVITAIICPVNIDHKITISGIDCPWVSDKAIHLYKAIEGLKIDVKSRVAVDIGASVGGFTEVLLQKGAKRVFAVDKEFGQLHSSLILNPRVRNIQKTDARAITAETFDAPVDLIVADLGKENYQEALMPVVTAIDGAFDLLAFINTKENAKEIERWLRLEMRCVAKKVPDDLQTYGHLIWFQKRA